MVGLILISIFPVRNSIFTNILNLDCIISLMIIIFILINRLLSKSINSLKKYHLILLLILLIPYDFILINIFNGTFNYLVYIFHFIHLFTMILSLRYLGSKFIEFTRKNHLDQGIILILAVFIICASLFFFFEEPINANVNYFDDAIWYSLASISSTGYGDIVPYTNFGRVVGSILMISGIAFASFATASAASSFIERYNEEKEKRKSSLKSMFENQKEIQKELNELKESVNELKEIIKK